MACGSTAYRVEDRTVTAPGQLGQEGGLADGAGPGEDHYWFLGQPLGDHPGEPSRTVIIDHRNSLHPFDF